MTYLDNSPIDVERLEKDFAILSRHLLQDPIISMDAQGVGTFLLSLPKFKNDGTPWDINPKHVWKSKNIGRDRVYIAINELCKLGYMEKIQGKNGNLNAGITYRISTLKKFFRHPESQDTEAQYPESQDFKKKQVNKNPLKKETTTTTANEEPPKKTSPKPKPKTSSSSETFCLEKDEAIKHLPLTTATKFNLQRFSLEILKYAAAMKIPSKVDSIDGHFFGLCIRLEDGTQSMKATASSSEDVINSVKSTLQDMLKDVTLPPEHEIEFVKGGYNLIKNGNLALVVGYSASDCIEQTEKIIKYLKEQNDK